jgi:trk system potassium uptake protein TrkH
VPTDTHRIRIVLFVDGILLVTLSAAMSIPMLVDLAAGNPDWQIFAASAVLTLFVGGMFVLSMRGEDPPLGQRTGYLLTVSAWVMIGAFASLPLFFSRLGLSYTDAFFETMSGLTTTGSTIISGLDDLPPGLLLWRSLLQWIGGVGIVVMAIVLLPILRTGGMQLFRTESSDISGKPLSRTRQIAGVTIAVYVGLSVLCAIAYAASGMNAFDAINHAMTTLSTGGYSTRDASIGYYDSVPIEVVGIVFMVAGALPLIWYARLIMERGRKTRAEGRQVPVLLAILLIAAALATVWNVLANGMPVATALRLSAFNVTSILTDTGYATSDFSAWGSFAVGLFFSLYLIGGCAGSTSGAIKIFRWQILADGIGRQLKRMFQPHRVLLAGYGAQRIDEETVQAVRNFFVLYMMTLLTVSLAVMATGIDFLSSISAVAQAMANAGPGLGQVGGPAGNFSTFPDPAKWLLAVAMLLGRLELSTVYVLLLADYWRS